MIQRSPQMLTSSINSAIIKIRKITLIPCYYLIYIPTSDFSDYPTDVIFGLVSNLLLYVAFSCYVNLLSIPCYYLIYRPTSDFNNCPTDVISGLQFPIYYYTLHLVVMSVYCGPHFSGFLDLSWPLHF